MAGTYLKVWDDGAFELEPPAWPALVPRLRQAYRRRQAILLDTRAPRAGLSSRTCRRPVQITARSARAPGSQAAERRDALGRRRHARRVEEPPRDRGRRPADVQ